MTLREKIIEEVKELKEEPLVQKPPRAAIEYVEDNYPEVVDFLSTEGMIVGLLRVLELLDEEQNNTNTNTDTGDDVQDRLNYLGAVLQ